MPNARPNTAPATPAPATPTPTPALSPSPVQTTTQTRVACDGGGGALGHPQVWLNLGAGGRIACPYCSCVFVLTPETAAEDAPASPRGAG